MIISAQTSGNLSTNSSSWTPIPGLKLTLPMGVSDSILLILNVPNPWATGNNYPGGNFGIQINGVLQAPYASFTYNEQQPPSTGRIPTTLCAVVPLSGSTDLQAVAVWSGVRGSTVNLDSPATFTAVIA
jgi:mannose-binding lectin